MKLVKKLVGVRKPKTSDALVVTTPTEGTVRINSNTVELLGVNYSAVLSEEGVRCEIGAVAQAENGDLIFGIALPTNGEGSKLAQPSKKEAGTLQFNNANIWAEIGGTTETNTTYKVSAENNVVTRDEDGNMLSLAEAQEAGRIDEDGCFVNDNPEEGEVAGEKATVWYILEFICTEPKPVRKKAEKGEDSDDEDSDDEDSDDEAPVKGSRKRKA